MLLAPLWKLRTCRLRICRLWFKNDTILRLRNINTTKIQYIYIYRVVKRHAFYRESVSNIFFSLKLLEVPQKTILNKVVHILVVHVLIETTKRPTHSIQVGIKSSRTQKKKKRFGQVVQRDGNSNRRAAKAKHEIVFNPVGLESNRPSLYVTPPMPVSSACRAPTRVASLTCRCWPALLLPSWSLTVAVARTLLVGHGQLAAPSLAERYDG